LDNFAGHNLNFETERLMLRPFEDADFDLALPFYEDPDFLAAMEGKSLGGAVTGAYLIPITSLNITHNPVETGNGLNDV
jgi:hypothetical protein